MINHRFLKKHNHIQDPVREPASRIYSFRKLVRGTWITLSRSESQCKNGTMQKPRKEEATSLM